MPAWPRKPAFSISATWSRAVTAKMIRRHPHVFGDEADAQAEPPPRRLAWEKLKAEERAAKGQTSLLDDVAGALPALTAGGKASTARFKRRI